LSASVLSPGTERTRMSALQREGKPALERPEVASTADATEGTDGQGGSGQRGGSLRNRDDWGLLSSGGGEGVAHFGVDTDEPEGWEGHRP
jgi:hypothetical protein